jgi:hypothetical protein
MKILGHEFGEWELPFWIAGSVGAFAVVFLILGLDLIGLVLVFFAASIVMRIPDTYSDAFTVESVGSFGMVLTLAFGPGVGVPFCLVTNWVSRFTSPFCDVEDATETFSESFSISIACVVISIVARYVTELVPLIVIFWLVNFTFYYLFMSVVAPALILNELANGVYIIILSILESCLLIFFLMNIASEITTLGSHTFGSLTSLFFWR